MFETSSESPAPVRVVSEALKEYIDRLGPIWIEGEISELNERSGGMAFMRLRDTSADMSISVMCYKSVLATAQPLPANARVVIHAKPSWFTKNGSLTMSAKEIRQVGVGELLARLEALKEKLALEGLFASDRKVKLPLLPRTIGLICGRNTDAEKDVVENARRRWPAVQFEIREVAVQGAAAVVEVSQALRELEADPLVDVIAGRLRQEPEIEILAQVLEVLDRVGHEPGQRQHQKDERDHLNGQRSVACIVEKLAEPKGILRRINGNGHFKLPGSLVRQRFPSIRTRHKSWDLALGHLIIEKGRGNAAPFPCARLSGTAASTGDRRWSTERSGHGPDRSGCSSRCCARSFRHSCHQQRSR